MCPSTRSSSAPTQGTITVPRAGRRHAHPHPSPPIAESLAEIARVSGGKAYTAQTASG